MQPQCIARTIMLGVDGPSVLATGAWFKNTLCLTRGDAAFVSRSVGDLDSADACIEHESVARIMLDWQGSPPAAIAHDLHPDFHSTRFAVALAAELEIPAIAVQHHHAHIAALCAEHDVVGPVLGLALDGVGLGTDGTAWGGELLRVEGAASQRLGYLQPLALPGGDRAAREPWRMAASVLHALGRGSEISARFPAQHGSDTIAVVLEKGLNCPQASSMGRVFDAAAGLLGLCLVMTFEAEAAIALEQAATRHVVSHGMPAPVLDAWRVEPDGQLNLLPLLAALAAERDVELGAALFHATLVAALGEWVGRAAEASGLDTIACGGGCFFNQLLSAGLRQNLGQRGLVMLEARQQLPGDTAIALGQAWVARHFLVT